MTLKPYDNEHTILRMQILDQSGSADQQIDCVEYLDVEAATQPFTAQLQAPKPDLRLESPVFPEWHPNAIDAAPSAIRPSFAISSKRSIRDGLNAVKTSPFQTVFVIDTE